jgi:hypothetical protein
MKIFTMNLFMPGIVFGRYFNCLCALQLYLSVPSGVRFWSGVWGLMSGVCIFDCGYAALRSLWFGSGSEEYLGVVILRQK